jgi:hypothetical protein
MNYILSEPIEPPPFSCEIFPRFPAPHYRAGRHFRGQLPYG